MKKLITITLAVAVIALFSQCRYDSRNWQVYFYKSTKTDSVSYLYINDVRKGVLPYLVNRPDCDDDSSKQQALHLNLPSGRYDVTVKDPEGHAIFNETLTIKLSHGDKSISVTQNAQHAGSRNTGEDNCLVHEIYFRPL